jgi:hypothetical protein
MVTVAIERAFVATSITEGPTAVQVDSSLGVPAAAPTNTLSTMSAAAAYSPTCVVSVVPLEISIRRTIFAPGARWSTMYS